MPGFDRTGPKGRGVGTGGGRGNCRQETTAGGAVTQNDPGQGQCRRHGGTGQGKGFSGKGGGRGRRQGGGGTGPQSGNEPERA